MDAQEYPGSEIWNMKMLRLEAESDHLSSEPPNLFPIYIPKVPLYIKRVNSAP
jgi:hypothetical protein